jgi:riboflavin-specific deaminase-like protein
MNSRLRRIKSQLPFVLVNMAMTADGKIATANRAVHSFGSARDLKHLSQLRATADAVMSGARTIEISRSILDPGGEKFRKLRLRNGLAEYNLRVVVSGSGSVDPAAAIFKTKFSPLIVLTTGRASPKDLRRLKSLADVVKVCGKTEIDFRRALRWLRTVWNVRRLLCEGGGELNDALFRAGLVDEVHLTFCPKIFGGRAAPTIAEGRGFDRLVEMAAFKIQSIRRFEDELFTVFSREKQ